MKTLSVLLVTFLIAVCSANNGGAFGTAKPNGNFGTARGFPQIPHFPKIPVFPFPNQGPYIDESVIQKLPGNIEMHYLLQSPVQFFSDDSSDAWTENSDNELFELDQSNAEEGVNAEDSIDSDIIEDFILSRHQHGSIHVMKINIDNSIDY
jgi:hypothetical protein